jgi:hypothetical protein
MLGRKHDVVLLVVAVLTVLTVIRVRRHRSAQTAMLHAPVAPERSSVEQLSTTIQLPVELVDRIESAFRDVYLTLISIIQGVAFSFLAASAFSDPHPNLNQWIAYTICLISIIVVWQEYMVGATAFTWTPSIFDSVVPFGLGIVEFLLIANVKRGTEAFLVCFAIFLGVGIVGYGNWLFHARRGADLNKKISYPILGRYVRFGTTTCTLAFVALLGLLWAHGPIDLSDTVFLLTALGLFSPLFFHSIFNWSLPLYRIHLAERGQGKTAEHPVQDPA